MKRIAILLIALLSFAQLGAQEQTTELIAHTVRKGDTVNKICRTYGISLQELLEINPSARAGLKRGTLIYIPKKSSTVSQLPANVMPAEPAATRDTSVQAAVTVAETVAEPETEPEPEAEPEMKAVSRTYGNPLIDDTPLAIGLALTLTSSRAADNNQIACMDFYSGFLLAMKHMKEEGLMNVTLNVYDTNKYTSAGGLQMPEEFYENDLIIGPVRKKEIEAVLPSLVEKGIPLVSPFDPNASALVPEYGNLVQVAMSAARQDSIAIELFCEDARERTTKPIILFEQGASKKLYEQTCNKLMEYGVEWHEFGYTILQGRSAEWMIASSLDTLKEYSFLIASNSEAFVNDAVRNLVILSEKRDIKLFGLPKWKHFDTIDALSYHKLKMSMPLQYWTDYNAGDEELARLLSEYRAMFGCEPNTYVLQGYDIARYFVWYGKKYGSSFINEAESFPQEDSSFRIRPLNTRYSFARKNPGSGFENNAVRVILYEPDLRVVFPGED